MNFRDLTSEAAGKYERIRVIQISSKMDSSFAINSHLIIVTSLLWT